MGTFYFDYGICLQRIRLPYIELYSMCNFILGVKKMEIKFDDSGLRDLQKRLNNLDKKQKENDGNLEIPFEELFYNEFMKEHTSFKTFDELLEKSGFQVDNQEDFKNIPDNEWNIFIKENTKFESWEEMQSEAGTKYVANQLGF